MRNELLLLCKRATVAAAPDSAIQAVKEIQVMRPAEVIALKLTAMAAAE